MTKKHEKYPECKELDMKVHSYPVRLAIFLVDEELEDPNTTKSGPSLPYQRNAIHMAFRWRADDGPTLKTGLVAL